MGVRGWEFCCAWHLRATSPSGRWCHPKDHGAYNCLPLRLGTIARHSQVGRATLGQPATGDTDDRHIDAALSVNWTGCRPAVGQPATRHLARI